MIFISIHAPAKGATEDGDRIEVISRISIHAPAKGATTEFFEVGEGEEISIHAPAKGATRYMRGIAAELLFQSTLPRRERRILTAAAQSTG